MKVEQIHHVAYRCKNAKQTVAFYQKVLGMDFLMAMAEDRAPSTKAPELAKARRTPSPVPTASSGSAPGRMAANSSPPRRATRPRRCNAFRRC